MRKILYVLGLFLFFVLFDTNPINAQEGTCIIKQQNITYEVSTPFYWYEVKKEVRVNNMMVSEDSYSHTKTFVENIVGCNSINGKKSKYENGLDGNFLNSRTTNYYFNSSLKSSSEEIYNLSLQQFRVPSLDDRGDYSFSSTYISFDELPPVIVTDEINSTIIANVDNKISIKDLKSKITAYDECEGIVEVTIKEDLYSDNYNKLGTYNVTFQASDTSGNTAELIIKIKVIDTIAPQISGQTSINSYMSNPLTIEQIKTTRTVTDNYDSNLNGLLEISSDNYSGNTQKQGTFKIIFTVKDTSNNVSLPFTISITMLDDIAPTISGEQSYKINVKNKLNLNEIISQLTATDNVDKNPIIEIKDDAYTANYFKVGIYQVSFIAKDSSQNTSSPFTININTEDTDSPIFYASQKFIGVDPSSQIPIEELITLINETNNINLNEVTEINIIEDNYSSNYSINGTYTIKLEYHYENKNPMIIESNVIVSDFTEETKNTPESKSIWSVIISFFIKIWNYIKEFFIMLRKLV